jgi:hypothetical protein
MTTKFFTYHQNNSGGWFMTNDNVAHYVIIEAPDAETADALAENVGIYFNGCATGADCDCCGDRWSSAYYQNGYDEPLIYSEHPEDYHDVWTKPGQPYCHVYYLDGRKVTHVKGEK